MQSSDVIVIGGGAVGCAAAYFLAREGLTVSLLERDDLAAHASGAAAGMLAPICESTGEGSFFELAFRSLGMFPALVPELRERGGVDPQCHVLSGILRVALSAPEARHLEEQAAVLARFGLESAKSRSRTGARAAARSGSPRCALVAPGGARLQSIPDARLRAGGGFPGGADRVRDGGRRPAPERRPRMGVETTAGTRHAGHVVLCAGVWTRFCAEWLGEPLPVTPVRGQILSLEAPRPPFHSIVWGEAAYLVPKLDGSVVVGGTEERVGFDCRTTAAGISGLLAAAPRLVPALADCSFRRAWAGLRPDTRDHLPAIGPLPGIEELTIAAGHFRNGVLLSPVTAQLVADRIVRGRMPAEAAAFLPARLIPALLRAYALGFRPPA